MNAVFKYALIKFVSRFVDHLLWLAVILTGLVIYLGSEIVRNLSFSARSSESIAIQSWLAVLVALIWVAAWLVRRWFEKGTSFAWFNNVEKIAFSLKQDLIEFFAEVEKHQKKLAYLQSDVKNVTEGLGRYVDSGSNRQWILHEHFLIEGNSRVALSGATVSASDNIQNHFGPTSATSVTTPNTTLTGGYISNETSTQIHYGYVSSGSAIVRVEGMEGSGINLSFGSSSRAQEVLTEVTNLVSDQSKIKRNRPRALAKLENDLEDLRLQLPGEEIRLRISEKVAFMGENLAASLWGNLYKKYLLLLGERNGTKGI